MYTIFGATGHTGGVVARQLLQQGQQVRAIVRDARKAEPLRALGAQIAQVDLQDRAQLVPLLRDVRGAYVMLPPRVDSPDLIESGRALTDVLAAAIAEARVPHVVLLSSIGAQLVEGSGPILTNRYAEQTLVRVTPALSALRPPYFMENWHDSLGALAEHRLPSMLALDHAIPMIATEDIGRAAAGVLLEGAQGSRVIELSGPRDYSPRDVARSLSTLLAREIVAEPVPNQAIVSILTGFGMSARNAELLREMHAGIDAGRITDEGGHARLRGRVPIEDVLRSLLT